MQKWSNSRIPALDGLRGLAILMVMLFHYSEPLGGRWIRSPSRSFGWTGVDLFFVLSGFLITGILLDTRGAENYFSGFYARRVLRIFPLYYFSLLVIALAFHPRGLAWYAVYAQNWIRASAVSGAEAHFGHFWSLAVEEQFYLLWPLIIYVSSQRRVLHISVAGIVVANALRLALWAHSAHFTTVYENPFTRMDALLAGSACACLLRDPVWVDRFRGHATLLQIAPAAALALMKFTPAAAPSVILFTRIGYPAVPLAYGALVLSVAVGSRSLLRSFLSTSSMRVLGKYSYAMYVWHLMMRDLVLKVESVRLGRELPTIANIPILIGVSLAAAAASYAVIERPFLRLKDRFKPRLKPRLTAGEPAFISQARSVS